MRKWYKRVIRIIIGIFLFALGKVLTINARLGVAPWVILDQGNSIFFGITVGQANITIGIIIIIIDVFLGQAIGWGSILNMFGIGFFMDLLMLNNLIPVFNGLPIRFIMLLLGVVLQGFATFFYISGGLGAGPRDGLVVALTNKGKRNFKFYKTTVEITVVIVGYYLGGDLGIGTVVMALFAGQIFQAIFDIVGFDVSTIEHRFIHDDISYFKKIWNERK